MPSPMAHNRTRRTTPTAKQRQALRLRDQRLTHRQIAERLGLTRPAVTRRLSRAAGRLAAIHAALGNPSLN